MTQSPKTFDDFKKEMQNHWKDEIVPPTDLIKKSEKFYIKHVQDYSINCLFIELLDFQIQLSEEQENFPFIYPVQEENNYAIARNLEEKSKTISKPNFLDCVDSLIIKDNFKNNLITFLNDNPNFDYYFWNVTFPNIFVGFISSEYCTKAALFLNYFQNDKEIFSKGVLSFITHNYYFKDSFMKSFFINSQNSDLNFEKNIQNSLIKAVQKLTIQQLDTLEILIDKYPEKAMEMFLEKIIINNIKLWKYSPLYSPSKINGKKERDLLQYIDNQFKKDENHKEKLQDLLNPVFDAIKSKITINEIKIERIIFDEVHRFAFTFLDILIIQKVTNFQEYAVQMGSLLTDKFDNRFLFKKAFYYIIFGKTESRPIDMRQEVEIPDKIKFDVAYFNKWNKFKEDKERNNKNPLEVFYKEEEHNELFEKDPQLALTGIASSYYSWFKYTKTKAMLKRESKALIPLNAIIESQKNFMEMISTYYAFTFRIPHEDFPNNLKKLFLCTMKNIMLKFIKKKFIRSNKYDSTITYYYIYLRQKIEENKKKETKENNNEIDRVSRIIEKLKNDRNKMYDQVISTFNEKIENELTQNIGIYFNNKDSAEKLYDFTIENLSYLFKNYIDPTAEASLTDYRISFDKYIEYMQYLTRAYLISTFNDEKFNIVELSSPIKMPKFDMITNDLFLNYVDSGIFYYINIFVESLESGNFDLTKTIPIGQVFAAVPVINKFLKQFVSPQNLMFFLTVNNISNEKELAQLIFGYAFKFYSIKEHDAKKESSIDEYEKKATNFVVFILTALNELCIFKDILPYFEKLNDEFEFLKEFLPI